MDNLNGIPIQIEPSLPPDTILFGDHAYLGPILKFYKEFPGWRIDISIMRRAYGLPNMVSCVKCGWKTDRPTRHKGKCKKRLREQATAKKQKGRLHS